MPTLAARLSAIPGSTGQAPWPDHEYVRGWGVFALTWTLTARTSPAVALLNSLSPLLPLTTWRLELAGSMPSSHEGLLMPERMYFVDTAHAVLDGLDLGRPTRLEANPTIGGAPLPARGVLAEGQGMWRVQEQGALR